MAMLRRTLSGVFQNASDLPLAVNSLPVSGASRRFVASVAPVANDQPVLALPNLGTRSGDLTAANSSTAPLRKFASGRTYLQFDGTDDVLTCANSDATAIGTGVFTTYVVGRYRSLPTSGHYWPIIDMQGGGGFGFTTQGANMMMYRGSLFTTTTATDTNWHVFIGVFNGASSVFKRDNGTEQTGNPGAEAISTLKLGSGPSATKPAIDIAEFGLFDRALDSTERAALASSLVSNYAIT